MEVAKRRDNCIYSTMQLRTQSEVAKLLDRVTFLTPKVSLNKSQFCFLTTANWSKGDLTEGTNTRVYLRRAKQTGFTGCFIIRWKNKSHIWRLIKSAWFNRRSDVKKSSIFSFSFFMVTFLASWLLNSLEIVALRLCYRNFIKRQHKQIISTSQI